MACGPEDPGLILCLTQVRNGVIFFLSVFVIQFNVLIQLSLFSGE